MANTTIPITFREHLQLSAIGIQPTSISFQSLTLESDRFVCVRDQVDEQNQVVIIDLADANNVIRRPITADSAIMHPKEKIIALKAQRQLQIFNIETKTRIKSHTNSEDVVFWKWISNTTIGLVTETAVYHWTTSDSTSTPQKIFDRHGSLAGSQIINYRATTDEKWLALIGIAGNITNPSEFKIKGTIQLYSRERNVSQIIEGHAAAFAEVTFDSASAPTSLFIFSARTAAGAKLHIVEIDHNPANAVFAKKTVDIYFPPEAASDFPVAMQVSKTHGIIYLVTKYGFIHLYDMETGARVYMNRISGETIFVTAEHEATGGIIGVNRKGQVLSVSIDQQTFIPYILNTLNNTELAFKMASRANLPLADGLYVQRPPVDSHDYSKGEARHHHRLYIETGDIVIQAEMAIFKVHRHLLMMHSPVLEDLLNIPTGSSEKEGTDEKPIILSDKANAWAWLLNSFYPEDPLLAFEYDWEQTVAVLEVANKYCMKKLEDTLVRRIQKASTKGALIQLLQASRIVDSRDLYVQAIRGMAASDPPLTVEEAKQVGIQAYFDINACKSGQFSG